MHPRWNIWVKYFISIRTGDLTFLVWEATMRPILTVLYLPHKAGYFMDGPKQKELREQSTIEDQMQTCCEILCMWPFVNACHDQRLISLSTTKEPGWNPSIHTGRISEPINLGMTEYNTTSSHSYKKQVMSVNLLNSTPIHTFYISSWIIQEFPNWAVPN